MFTFLAQQRKRRKPTKSGSLPGNPLIKVNSDLEKIPYALYSILTTKERTPAIYKRNVGLLPLVIFGGVLLLYFERRLLQIQKLFLQKAVLNLDSLGTRLPSSAQQSLLERLR